MEKLLTIQQVAEVTGVSVHTLYQWVNMRRIPFVRLGRALRFKEKDIEKWVGKNTYEAKESSGR